MKLRIRNVGECVYLDILNHAERYVRIMTPYLILDETMVMALTFAAKRGVDVELILPHVPDKKFAFALAKGHYRELLDAGVKIYEYTPGFVHAKVFVSDDRKAVVGTINLDYRSLYLHFEDAVYLYDCPCIKDIVADYDATRAQSQIVTHGDLACIPLHTRIAAALLKLVQVAADGILGHAKNLAQLVNADGLARDDILLYRIETADFHIHSSHILIYPPSSIRMYPQCFL